MKSFARILMSVGGCLCLAISPLLAEEAASTDPGAMLKVPPAEARPTGDESSEQPAPESSPQSSSPIPEEGAEAPVENAENPAEGGVVLPAFPLTRYEPLWERSPFQLESVAPPVESAGLAQRFALTGLAEINGEPIAFIMDRATQNRLMVRKDSSEGGVSLVQVDVQKKYIDSTATLRQGAEVGVVRFDAGAAGAVPPPMAQQVMPTPRAMPPPVAAGIPPQGVPPQMPQIPQIPGQAQAMPAIPTAPGVVPPVPGPGVPQDGQVQGGNGQMPPPRVIRRRALIPAAP
jgi:hypothetical protein